MRIAVFSDIHGNYQALCAILNHIKKNNIDKIIYLGDAVSIGPDSSLCVKKLISDADIFILGNHEHYIIVMRKLNITIGYLKRLINKILTY